MKTMTLFILVALSAALLLTLPACQTSQRLVPATGSTGDPPLIPHEVDAADGGDVCLECHRTGEEGAPKYPDWHATLVDCGQCHVPVVEKVAPFKTSY